VYRGHVHRGDEEIRRVRRDILVGAIGWGVLIAAFASVMVVSLTVTPDDLASGRVAITPRCPMQAIFHRDCPTCGLTRGFAALGHGRWTEAIAHNRATPVAFGGCLAAIALGVGGLYRSIRAYRRVLPRRTT